MKKLSTLLLLFLLTTPAAASLQECRKLMTTANKVCKDDLGCKKNYLEVSGADFIQTLSSVICRGEKNLIHGASSQSQTNSKAKQTQKVSKKNMHF